MLPGAVAFERFKPIARRRAKIGKSGVNMQRGQFPLGDGEDIGGKPLQHSPQKYRRRPLVFERLDHCRYMGRNGRYVKQNVALDPPQQVAHHRPQFGGEGVGGG